MSCHHYHSRCAPGGPYYPSYFYPGYWPPFPYYYSCCPVCRLPAFLCACAAKPPAPIPKELDLKADDTQTTFIGGAKDVNLTLEYKPADPANAKITVTVADGEGSSEWVVTGIPAGYHVKSEFAKVTPGATVTIKTTKCPAHLKWCEYPA